MKGAIEMYYEFGSASLDWYYDDIPSALVSRVTVEIILTEGGTTIQHCFDYQEYSYLVLPSAAWEEFRRFSSDGRAVAL